MSLFVNFLLLFLWNIISFVNCCQNYSNVDSATVFSYWELKDAIDCNVDNILVGNDLTFPNEILIYQKSINITSNGNHNLIANENRIFLVQDSNLTLSHLKLQGGQIFNEDGGAIKSENSQLWITYSTISHGNASNGGGISFIDSFVALEDVRIESNSANEFGGGIDCVTSQLNIKNSFISNNIGKYGGSIATEFCQVSFENTLLSNSTALNAGGCMYAIQSSKVTMLQTNLSYCRVELSPTGLNEASQGGGIFGSDIALTLTTVDISNCYAAVGSVLRATEIEVVISHSKIYDNRALISTIETIGMSSVVTISNTKIFRNLAYYSTSVLCCGYGAHCSLTNTEIYQNQAFFTGGISVEFTATATLQNCTFRGNYAGTGPAIISSFRSQVFATNCTFERNIAIQSAGACLVSDLAEMELLYCQFLGNQAISGGSIYVRLGSSLISNQSTFSYDIVTGLGGSIVISESSTGSFYKSSFSNCEGVYGGALYVYSYSNVTVDKTDFRECVATYEGGSIAGYQYSNLIITDSSFIGNTAVYGGALFGQLHVHYTLYRCSIQNNTATYMGGGMDVQDETILLIEDSTFLDNIASFHGAGISSLFSTLQILRIYSENNKCEYDGGVIHSIFSTPQISDSTFISNQGQTGGVIACTSNSTCLSTNNKYFSNSASYGGVLSVDLSSMTSIADVFDSNRATSGGIVYSTNFLVLKFQNITASRGKSVIGGVMTISNGAKLEIDIGLFLKNEATNSGGALFLLNIGSVQLNHLNFTANLAQVDGGAAAIYGEMPSDISEDPAADMKLIITNSYFYSNIVQQRGGALYGNDIYNITIFNTTFEKNKAASGGAVSTSQSTGIIYQSTFLNNMAQGGGGGIFWFYEVGGPILHVDSSCVATGNSAVYGSFKATNVYKLTATRNVNSEENSGSQVENPIFVDMRDYYDQVVVNDLSSESTGTVVYCSTADSFSSLQGSTIEPTYKGVATFGNFTVTYKPNSTVTLYFDMSSSVERAEYQIQFRPCVVGEIVLSLFGETTICSKCSPGSYSIKLNSQKCKLCPEHAICRGGDVIDVNPGYWRMGSEYELVSLCLAKDACKGGDDPENQCRKGHKGPYCSVCEDDYYKRGGVCLSCSDSGASLVMTLLPTICFLFCLFLYYLWIIREKFLHYFWDRAGVLAKTAEKYHLTGLRTKFKILLAFVQIINQIPFALDVDFPQIYLQFLDILWIFNLDFVQFLNFECIYQRNFYDKLVEATLGPFILMSVVITVLLTRLFIAYRLNSLNPSYTYSQFRKESIFCSLLLSFIVFSPVSIQVFQTFACESFEDGTSRLISDYTILCSGSEYQFYQIYSILMILIYPVGVPTLYFILLYSNHDQVNPPTRLVVRDSERDLVSNVIIQQEKIKLRNTYTDIFVISFLYLAYEPSRWYFEILDCIRRLMMTAVPVLIMRGAITQIIIVLLVSLGCVAAYMELKPYTTPSDNSVAVLSQWAITLTLVVSILIRIGEEQGLNRQTLGIIAILLNSAVFVVTIMLILFGEEEFNPSAELQTFESQSQLSKKQGAMGTTKMKLSSFIHKQDVEMIDRKISDEEEENSNKQNHTSGSGSGSRSRSASGEAESGSISIKSKQNGIRGSIIGRRGSVQTKGTNKETEKEVKQSTKREDMRSSIFGRRSSAASAVAPPSFSSSTSSSSAAAVAAAVGAMFDEVDEDHDSTNNNGGRISRLRKTENNKDSDDESDSDDDQEGDSDDDTSTSNKKNKNRTNPSSTPASAATATNKKKNLQSPSNVLTAVSNPLNSERMSSL